MSTVINSSIASIGIANAAMTVRCRNDDRKMYIIIMHIESLKSLAVNLIMQEFTEGRGQMK